jgi:hypothetical protein
LKKIVAGKSYWIYRTQQETLPERFRIAKTSNAQIANNKEISASFLEGFLRITNTNAKAEERRQHV